MIRMKNIFMNQIGFLAGNIPRRGRLLLTFLVLTGVSSCDLVLHEIQARFQEKPESSADRILPGKVPAEGEIPGLQLSSRIEPDSCHVGDTVQWIIEVEASGNRDVVEPVINDPSGGFVSRARSVSRQTSYINGEKKEKLVMTLLYQATEQGDWTFPSVSIPAKEQNRDGAKAPENVVHVLPGPSKQNGQKMVPPGHPALPDRVPLLPGNPSGPPADVQDETVI